MHSVDSAAPFSGRLITLTGGAGGIGRAAARVFLDRGARVHLVDVDRARLDAAAQALGASGRVVTTVSTLDSPAECARALEAAQGPSFALVHLAGIFEPDDPAAGDRDAYRRVLDANLTNGYDVAGAWRERADTGSGPARIGPSLVTTTPPLNAERSGVRPCLGRNERR